MEVFLKLKIKIFVFSSFILSLFFLSFGQTSFAKDNSASLIQQLKKIDANLIFMRHALAPGFGDPKNFNLNSCKTQRNLDASGRKQAIDSGNYLRRENLKLNTIYSSEWCRCLETAKLLNFNIEKPFAGLNSFYEGHASKKETLNLLNKKMSQLDNSTLTLMVTHQVVISAVTGINISSGEMVAYNTHTGKANLLNLLIRSNPYKH
jgi:phosphohistidine phosphatase SixA